MDQLTVDELAHRSGLPSSTIRMYQARGLLPPPARRGRTAVYDDGHLARLELIGRLQQRGFSLAAIAELVEGWQEGRDLHDVLGLERSVAALATHAEVPVTLSLIDLVARFPDTPITPEVLRRTVDLGLVELGADGATVVVRSPTFLDVGAALVAMGFPLDEVLDEYEQLGAVVDGLADRFAGLFERHLWRPFAEAGMPTDRVGELAAAFSRLVPLADRIVAAALRRSLDATADRFLAKEAGSP